MGDWIIQFCDCGFSAIEAMRRLLKRPQVETISTVDLRAAMGSSDDSLVLVDVRSESELAVSRIPGAITLQDYEGGDFAGRRVVAYCTVGGRSYMYARRLLASGVDAVNYRDSILGWCHAGLPLESPEGDATNAVHPYWRIFSVPDQYDVQN